MFDGILIPLAFIIEVVLGAPPAFLNPFILLSGSAEGLTRYAAEIRYPLFSKIFGVLIALIIPAFAWFIINSLISTATRLHPLFGQSFSVFFIYTAIRIRDPLQTASKTYHHLVFGNIGGAQQSVSELTGRPVEGSETGVIESLLWTLSRSISCQLISPLFYAFIGGAPLAAAARTLELFVNWDPHPQAASSTWGPDLVSRIVLFLPLRLCALLLALAAGLEGRDPQAVLHTIRRDRNRSSFCGRIILAGLAGALQIRISLPQKTRSSPVREYVGDGRSRPGREHIRATVRLLYLTAMLAISLIVILNLTLPF